MRGITSIRYAFAALAVTSISVSAWAQATTPSRVVYADVQGLVYGYLAGQVDGALTPTLGSPVAAPFVLPPTSLAADPAGHYLYVSNYGTIQVYQIDPATAALHPIGQIASISGNQPMAMHPSGRFLFGLGGEGASINAFSINSASSAAPGMLTPITGSPFATGQLGGPETILVDPSGKFLFAGTNTSINPALQRGIVYVFGIDQITGALTEAPGSPFLTQSPAGGADSLAVTPDSRFLYAGSDSDLVTWFAIDAATGALTWAGSLSPNTSQSIARVAGMAIDPAGHYLFTNVATFAISATDGSLNLVEPYPFDPNRHSLVVDPSGSFLYDTDNSGDVCGASIQSDGTQVGGLCVFAGSSVYDLAMVQTGNPTVTLPGGVAVTFNTVSTAGVTTVNTASACPGAPGGYQLGATCYDISTTAVYTPPVQVCITDPSVTAASSLFHFEGGVWVDITTSQNPPTICGEASSLSPFAIGQPFTPIDTSTALGSTLNPATAGQSVTLTATVTPTSGTGTPTGSVTFYDGAAMLGAVALSNGIATYATSSLAQGTHAITAQYSGDHNFNGSTSPVFPEVVNAAISATTATLASSINPSAYGQAVTFTAAIASAGGTPSGTVTFTDGANGLGASALSGGVAARTVSLATGLHSIVATYGGSAAFTGSTSAPLPQTVNPAASTVTLAVSPNPSSFGQPVTFSAVVAPLFGGAATGSVAFMDGGATAGIAAVTANSASANIGSLGAGTHSLTAVYSGDANVSGSTSAPVALTIAKAVTTTTLTSSVNPANVNQSVTFTATVSGQSGAPTGTVTFKSGAAALGSAALSNGSAALTTSFASAGGNSITAVYSGDANYSTSTSAVLSETVTSGAKAPTTTSLTVSALLSLVGQPLTFTATVKSSIGAPPNGETVTFGDRGSPIGTGTTSAGVASFTTTSLTAGLHSITAAYPGDTAFASSASTAIPLLVSKYLTKTTLVSSLNPSAFGQAVTFRATVTSTGPLGIGGTVTFRSGEASLAKVPISGGTASYTTANLATGAHHITATYDGDSGNFPSISAVLTQTVNKAPTAVSLASSLNPSTFGQAITLTATVTSPTGGTPTGSVTFKLGTTTLGTVTLNGSGVAALTTSSLGRGNDAISATYNGASNFATGTATLTQTVN